MGQTPDTNDTAPTKNTTVPFALETAAAEVATGTLITLFTLVFFLMEGERIWLFIVGLLPRRARTAAGRDEEPAEEPASAEPASAENTDSPQGKKPSRKQGNK